jgi:hypothetical protein
MDTFINKSKEKFGNLFSYQNLNYISTKKPVNLYCSNHKHSFIVNIKNHLDTKAGGCSHCDLDIRFNEFNNKSKEKYGDNFLINKNTFTNGNNKTEIKCIKHDNNFSISLQKHLKQTDGGCFKCNKNYSGNIIISIINKSKEKFNDNYDFTYFQYITAITKSKLRCKKHDTTINISPSDHINLLYGGCIKCANEDKTIEKEKKINAIEKKKLKSNSLLEKDEEFKILTLSNFENLYKISNYGKVYSIKNNIYMKLFKNNNGYMQIRLYDNNGKGKHFRVHQLVAYIFIENKDNKKYVDHIDRCRENNYYKNLRWVTHSENMNNKNNIKTNIINVQPTKINNNFKPLKFMNNINFSNYVINEDGVIMNKKNKILKSHINGGYYIIILKSDDNIKYNIRIHRLVAYTFIDKPNDFIDTMVVNHIDENKLNNNYKNLEWCTSAENTQKYFKNKMKDKDNQKNEAKNKKKFCQIDIKTNNIINKFNRYIDACKYLNLSSSSASSISYCCKGYRKTAFGYKWQYID